MKLSVKSDYAARAVLGLARHFPTGTALRVEDLAAKQGVPANYLVQILIELKAQGIARGARQGGGLFAGASAGRDFLRRCIARGSWHPSLRYPALSDADCPPELRRAWLRLQATMESAANSVSFQRLLEESSAKEKMYYI